MGDFDPLAVDKECDGVFADNVTTAHGHHADIAELTQRFTLPRLDDAG